MPSSPARLLAPLLAATAVAACPVPGAAAEEGAEASLRRRLYFYTGVDIARDSGYGWGGMAWAPFADMDREGLRLRTQAGGGRYDYRTQAVAGGWNSVDKTDGEVLLGWQFLRGAHALAVYAGVNIVDNRLDTPDPGNRDAGTHWGGKAVVEWFYRLDERWTLTASLSGSTADGSVSGRATAAWRAFPWLDLGVEAGATSDWPDESARLGLFLACPLRSGEWLNWELRAAAGWNWSGDSDDSPYGTLSLFIPF